MPPANAAAAPPAELAYVALGSNLGPRAEHLARAREAIAGIHGCTVLAASTVEETAPLGGLDQPPYLNQMLAMACSLEPHALLDALHAIERSLGRVRGERWASRTIDLDIVRFDDRRLDDDRLTIPHPGLADRPFWQRALAELGAEETP
jgi:2-amino-4-hydroxy-6-hydroxymethyldihydropteridine diphosphokinase